MKTHRSVPIASRGFSVEAPFMIKDYLARAYRIINGYLDIEIKEIQSMKGSPAEYIYFVREDSTKLVSKELYSFLEGIFPDVEDRTKTWPKYIVYTLTIYDQPFNAVLKPFGDPSYSLVFFTEGLFITFNIGLFFTSGYYKQVFWGDANFLHVRFGNPDTLRPVEGNYPYLNRDDLSGDVLYFLDTIHHALTSQGLLLYEFPNWRSLADHRTFSHHLLPPYYKYVYRGGIEVDQLGTFIIHPYIELYITLSI